MKAICVGFAAAVLVAQPGFALDQFSFEAPGAPEDLRELLRGASLSRDAYSAKKTEAQEIFAAARADYARLLGALYDQGYYGPTISILIDGREAAAIPPMDAPETIRSVAIHVTPGPQFHFGEARVEPLTRKTALPGEFSTGSVARSGLISDAARAGIEGWRDSGHAKARIAEQKIVADHRAQALNARVTLDPGPQLTFGEMQMEGYDRLRPERLAEIAGFPSGERFSPDELDEVRNRLRRTGIFSSVALTEAAQIGPNNTLDAQLSVVEDKPRRLGFGAEYSTVDGLNLNGYWMHRNLLGGGERLRVDAEIAQIGAASSGMDYSLGARLDRPATFTPDTSAFVTSEIGRRDTEDYIEDYFTAGFGLDHIFNERLSGSAEIAYQWSQVEDDLGEFRYRLIALPLGLTWDNRDNATDATRGYFGDVTLTPFMGLGATGSGARLTGDFRTYRGFGEDSRFVLAGRAQIGAVFGPTLLQTPRNYLFYSGGGGTVRGQPFESLGVSLLKNGTIETGGTRFMAFSGEFRAGVTDSIGVVAFYDRGFVSADEFFSDSGEWHAGAGLGLRYKTAIGPIRLDVATPVEGDTGEGVQLYIGIGQAF
ncbi:autotransporter assembly complex protein TamA [Sinirhodobacter sp. HNIBRBA609]|nr:autotransporter assembly complex protein TamA [Sinirhodobacter sp. HNIBRBA609]